MGKMKLGPIQKEWIQSLKNHPERQMLHRLGKTIESVGGKKIYRACCLGEGLMVLNRRKGINIPDGTSIVDGNSLFRLSNSYEELGLRSPTGRTKYNFFIKGKSLSGLSEANDFGCSWPEIAKAIENNPDNFFERSV